jgi:hypothetical protein
MKSIYVDQRKRRQSPLTQQPCCAANAGRTRPTLKQPEGAKRRLRSNRPHWGYVTAGRLTVRYGDREEVIEPGDAFYMPPGHVPAAVAGPELVMFSPQDELAAVEAAMRELMMQKGN